MGRQNAEAELQLPPGFRFFPTDEELLVHYLCRRAASQSLPVPIIAEVDLYKYDPWQLPEKALFGEKEWYFFTPRDRKYPNGSRPNRAAGSGYWKATGADKPVTTGGGSKRVGIKKALVFYAGKAPRGTKSNWIMHEYRLADVNRSARKKGSLRLDDWVLCRIYNKKSSAEKIEVDPKECFMDESMESLEACDEKGTENLPTLNLSVYSTRESIQEQAKPSFHHLNRLNPLPANCNAISHDGLPVKGEFDSQNPVLAQNTIEVDPKECFLNESMESFGAHDEKGTENLPTLNLAVNSTRESIQEQAKPSFDHLNRLNPLPANCNAISHDGLPVKCELDSQNPCLAQNTCPFSSGTVTAPIPAPAFNPISPFANQWTNHTSADSNSGLPADSSSSKPSSSDPISEKEEVQSSFRLQNFLEEDHQSLFNFALEGLQNPFLQFDQMPSSNPYEEYIAGLAASEYLPRFYQNDMLLN